MKLQGNYFFTQKEDVKDEESVSANLLVRAGMIKKVGSGIYTFYLWDFVFLRKLRLLLEKK